MDSKKRVLKLENAFFKFPIRPHRYGPSKHLKKFGFFSCSLNICEECCLFNILKLLQSSALPTQPTCVFNVLEKRAQISSSMFDNKNCLLSLRKRFERLKNIIQDRWISTFGKYQCSVIDFILEHLLDRSSKQTRNLLIRHMIYVV